MSWYSYEDGREKKAELHAKIERKKAKGQKFEVLEAPKGRGKLTQTFWGKAWCEHLESYQDYENRLPRGRSYLRQGNVYNLVIEPGLVTALVAGSSLYEVNITIAALQKGDWVRIQKECAGQVSSLLDLLGGKLGTGVLQVITDRETGLFPKPKEIRLSCSCPDWADMCKHVAAVLYGVGVKFDVDPALFFRLRSVDPTELLAAGAHEALATFPGEAAELAGEDLSALFGIELGEAEVPALPVEVPPKKLKAPKSAKPKVAARPKAKKLPAKPRLRNDK